MEGLVKYPQLCLSLGLWCPNPAFRREQAVAVWVWGRGMMVEAVPRDSTELTHPALQAQRSTLQAPIYTEHTQACVPSPAHHSW